MGQSVVVTLAGNPSTGYRWEREGSHAGLELLREGYHGPARGPVGSGGVFRFELRATRAGTSTLRLRYAPDAERVTIHFRVR